jgi:flavin-dependent thymidylate synthase
MTKQVSKWADDFMFTAEKSDASAGPQAFLLSATPDPLGSIAVAAEAYMGRFYDDKSSITDEQRRYYLDEMQKTKLKMPMEAVSLHWRIKGVTRSFTHQMVRQRTAAYSQESMRFAVKEDLDTAVALPPTLQMFNKPMPDGRTWGDHVWDSWEDEHERMPGTQDVRWYVQWRRAVEAVSSAYQYLIEDGMPAEDARGLSPHNTVTQLNYITNLRNYQDHAGNRLCTQAQFEWRMVWTKMLLAMREFCTHPTHNSRPHGSSILPCDNWQWKAISELFLPVCYTMGSCQFQAEFDRKCSIRERVQENAAIGRPSAAWDQPHQDEDGKVFIGAIHPAEWLLDSAAAR